MFFFQNTFCNLNHFILAAKDNIATSLLLQNLLIDVRWTRPGWMDHYYYYYCHSPRHDYQHFHHQTIMINNKIFIALKIPLFLLLLILCILVDPSDGDVLPQLLHLLLLLLKVRFQLCVATLCCLRVRRKNFKEKAMHSSLKES